MDFVFNPDGTLTCLWTDSVPLAALFGTPIVERASRIEFNNSTGQWEVFIPADSNTVLFSNPNRKPCLDWEWEQIEPTL